MLFLLPLSGFQIQAPLSDDEIAISIEDPYSYSPFRCMVFRGLCLGLAPRHSMGCSFEGVCRARGRVGNGKWFGDVVPVGEGDFAGDCMYMCPSPRGRREIVWFRCGR